jgi:hypothetical protein
VTGPDKGDILRARRLDELAGGLDDPAHVGDVDPARGVPAVLVQEVVLVVDQEERRPPGDKVPPDGREGVGAGASCGDRVQTLATGRTNYRSFS